MGESNAVEAGTLRRETCGREESDALDDCRPAAQEEPARSQDCWVRRRYQTAMSEPSISGAGAQGVDRKTTCVELDAVRTDLDADPEKSECRTKSIMWMDNKKDAEEGSSSDDASELSSSVEAGPHQQGRPRQTGPVAISHGSRRGQIHAEGTATVGLRANHRLRPRDPPSGYDDEDNAMTTDAPAVDDEQSLASGTLCGSDVSTAAPLCALAAAAAAGDQTACRQALLEMEQCGESVESYLRSRDDSGQTILHILARIVPTDTNAQNVVEIARLLVHASAQPNTENLAGESALVRAVLIIAERPDQEENREAQSDDSISRLALVQELLKLEADPNQTDASYTTPLMEAACSGDLALCKTLLRFRADIHQTTLEGLCAVDFAETFPEVSYLLRSSARHREVEGRSSPHRGRGQQSPNQSTKEQGHVATLQQKSGPDTVTVQIQIQDVLNELWDCLTNDSRSIRQKGQMADIIFAELQTAFSDSKFDQHHCAEMLESRNSEGQLFLQLCCTPSPLGKTAEAAKLLIQSRTCLTVTDSSGETPLHLAVQVAVDGWKATEDVVHALLDAKHDANVCNDRGESPLMAAACAGSPLCKHLMNAGADHCVCVERLM